MFNSSERSCLIQVKSNSFSFQHVIQTILSSRVSPASCVPGHIPSPPPPVRDRPDGWQRQREELHRQEAGGSGCRPDRLRQNGPRGVWAGRSSSSHGAGGIWFRWENRWWDCGYFRFGKCCCVKSNASPYNDNLFFSFVDILNEDKTINRRALGKKVFGNQVIRQFVKKKKDMFHFIFKGRGCHTLLKPYETNCGLWIWAIQIKFDWLISEHRQFTKDSVFHAGAVKSPDKYCVARDSTTGEEDNQPSQRGR